jgi:hypothetical protein
MSSNTSLCKENIYHMISANKDRTLKDFNTRIQQISKGHTEKYDINTWNLN